MDFFGDYTYDSYSDPVQFGIRMDSNRPKPKPQPQTQTSQTTGTERLTRTTFAETSINDEELIIPSIAAILFVIGIIGFFYFTMTILRLKFSNATTTRWYLFQTSISGGILTLSLILIMIIKLNITAIKINRDLQLVQGAVVFFNLFSSSLFFTLISIERYLTARNRRSQFILIFRGRLFTNLASFFVWGISALISIPVAIHQSLNKMWQDFVWGFFIVVIFACLVISTFCVLIAVYVSTRLSTMHRNDLPSSANSKKQNDSKINVTVRDHSSVTIISAIMVMISFLGWLPFFLCFAGSSISVTEVTTSPGILVISTELVAYVATVINWYIYAMKENTKKCCLKRKTKRCQVVVEC